MILLPASAFLATLLGYLIALKVFPTIGLLDFPERYGLRRTRLPYPAGIVAVAVFLLFFVFTQDLGTKELGVVTAVLLLAVVSFIDDRRKLPASLRLLSHITIGVIIFIAGAKIFTITNPLGGIIKLDDIIWFLGPLGSHPILSLLFTVVWLLLTVNAMNWFDGIPGQVHVISVIGFLMLGFLAYYRNGEAEIALIAFMLAGIAAAGLLFDFPPGKMLIGDTGAMFFGLMLGLLGIYEGGKVATAFLAVGLPLFDAVIVILRRLVRGQSPFRGGRDHLHHLLLDHGWSARSIILLTAAIGTLFGVTALFLDTAQKAVALAILLVLSILLPVSVRRK